MTIRALLLLGGVSLALASVASAQSASSPGANANPPPAVEAPAAVPATPPAVASAPPAAHVPATLSQPGLPPQRIRAMVRASGYAPIGSPARRGNLYVQRARAPNAIEYRLVIDAVTGRTVAARPIRVAGPFGFWPALSRAYPPPFAPAYGRYSGPPSSDFGYRYGAPQPPRNVPLARLSPHPEPQQQAHPLPPSQPGTTAQAPLPRPKPYVAESTGSIPIDSPKPLAQKTPEPPKAAEAPAAAPQNNGAAALPPVAPLD